LPKEKSWETLITATDLRSYEYSDLIVLFQGLEAICDLRERIGQEFQHRESAIECEALARFLHQCKSARVSAS